MPIDRDFLHEYAKNPQVQQAASKRLLSVREDENIFIGGTVIMKGKTFMKGMIMTVILLAALSFNLFAGGGQPQSGSRTTPASASIVNNTGLPIVKEPITLHFVGMNMNNTRVGRWDETDMMKYLEEKTGIKIIWDGIPQNSWRERKNLIIASKELPDGFMSNLSLSAEEAQTLGDGGVLIPLEGLLDRYAPNVKALMSGIPSYEPFVKSPDGHIYAMASYEDLGFDSFSAAIIRKDWLDKLGLRMPTTTDELYNVLKTFKERDPAGNGKTIPMSFLFQENELLNREVKREFEWIFMAFGVADNPFRIAIQDDGKLIFTASQPGFRAAIQYLHKLYSEKLIDVELFTQDRNKLTNKIRDLSVGAYTDYRLKVSMASEEIQDLFTLIPPLKGPQGGNPKWVRGLIGMSEGSFAITSACKYPEAAIRWLDYINAEEINIQMRYGMFKDKGWTATEAQVPSDTAPGKWMVNTGMRPKEVSPNDWPFSAPIAVSPVISPWNLIDKFTAEKASNISKQEVCDFYRPYLTKYPYNYPYRFTMEEIEELSLLQTDLISYIIKTEAKWIDSGGIEQEWDSYLAQLKRYNVDRYVELYNTAYQRSLKK
jgi:putative aldouronate transport system substrate-binding protein